MRNLEKLAQNSTATASNSWTHLCPRQSKLQSGWTQIQPALIGFSRWEPEDGGSINAVGSKITSQKQYRTETTQKMELKAQMSRYVTCLETFWDCCLMNTRLVKASVLIEDYGDRVLLAVAPLSLISLRRGRRFISVWPQERQSSCSHANCGCTPVRSHKTQSAELDLEKQRRDAKCNQSS